MFQFPRYIHIFFAFLVMAQGCISFEMQNLNSTASMLPIRWMAHSQVNTTELQPAGKRGRQNYYIARTNFSGGILPGRVIDSQNRIYFSYNGTEQSRTDNYELLVYPRGSLKWVEVPSWEHLPSHLFPAGRDSEGTTLYLCRAWHSAATAPGATREEYLVPGVFSVPTKTCVIAHSHNEHFYDHYDVLVETGASPIIQTCYDEPTGGGAGAGFSLLIPVIAGLSIVLILLLLGIMITVGIQKALVRQPSCSKYFDF